MTYILSSIVGPRPMNKQVIGTVEECITIVYYMGMALKQHLMLYHYNQRLSLGFYQIGYFYY